MNKALVLVALPALLSSGATAKVSRASVQKCELTGGQSKDPFYGVSASQNVMPPINKARPIAVRGDYRLDMRSGRIQLIKAIPQGINKSILLLNIRRIADPKAGGHCLSFQGSFANDKYMQVQITDGRGRSITVPIKPLQ